MKMLNSKLFKFFYGIILLPFCYGFLKVFIFIIQKLEFSDRFVVIFLSGLIFYLIIHFCFYNPIRIYVIGHEFVHMISAWICGAKVSKVKLKKNSGAVTVNRVNTFIALSPYFVPVYSIFLVILWGIIKYVLSVNLKIEIFIFLLGITVMFHIVLTAYTISVGQSDFNISGLMFSLVVIFIINLVMLICIILFLLPVNITFAEVMSKIYFETKISYKNTLIFLTKTIKYFIESIYDGKKFIN